MESVWTVRNEALRDSVEGTANVFNCLGLGKWKFSSSKFHNLIRPSHIFRKVIMLHDAFPSSKNGNTYARLNEQWIQ